MPDNGKNGIYEQKKYFAIALDPIHIGTGGYRIGRVDNTIVREPATGIPKIPGTTIEGVCRSYVFLKAREDGEDVKPECAKGKSKREGDKKLEPCGNCRICITFGYTSETKSLQAMALFSDARILFFPVATMVGPVWVTCPMVLRDAEISLNDDTSTLKKIDNGENQSFITTEFILNKLHQNSNEVFLNFGWLLLGGNIETIDPSKWTYECKNDDLETNRNLNAIESVSEILNRVVIVPDHFFSQIVNSNLEVRTSVAIDPERGAAEEGALFTYEAIPRGAVFWFDVVYQNPAFYQINTINGCNNNDLMKCVKETVENGLSFFEYLGIGGMSSRGFGRIKVLK